MKNIKKLTACLLCLCMAVSLFGLTALAADAPDTSAPAADPNAPSASAPAADPNAPAPNALPAQDTSTLEPTDTDGDTTPDAVVGGTDYTTEVSAIGWLESHLVNNGTDAPYMEFTNVDGTTTKVPLSQYEDSSKRYYLANDTDSNTAEEAQQVVDNVEDQDPATNNAKVESGDGKGTNNEAANGGNQYRSAEVTLALLEYLNSSATNLASNTTTILWRVYVNNKPNEVSEKFYATDAADPATPVTDTTTYKGETVLTDEREVLRHDKTEDKYQAGMASVNDSSFNGTAIPGGSLDVSAESSFDANNKDVTLVTYKDVDLGGGQTSDVILGRTYEKDVNYETSVELRPGDKVDVRNDDGSVTTFTFTGWDYDEATQTATGTWSEDTIYPTPVTPNPPTVPSTPETPETPTTPENPEDIPDEDVPQDAQPEAPADIPDEDVPQDSAPGEEILDEEIPLDATPETGDASIALIAALIALLIISAISLTAVTVSAKKHSK